MHDAVPRPDCDRLVIIPLLFFNFYFFFLHKPHRLLSLDPHFYTVDTVISSVRFGPPKLFAILCLHLEWKPLLPSRYPLFAPSVAFGAHFQRKGRSALGDSRTCPLAAGGPRTLHLTPHLPPLCDSPGGARASVAWSRAQRRKKQN